MCGWDGDRFWEAGWPTSAICDCCGSESGIGDMGAAPGSWSGVEGLHAFRGWWLGAGARWERPRRQPGGWDVLRQLENVPAHWRTPAPPPPDRDRRIAERASHGSLGTEIVCRICGLPGEVRRRAGRPTETICPACGAESGIDDLGRPGDWDALHGIRARRGYWAAVGCPWAVPAARPATWDLMEQLARVPDAWR
ncbi:FmdB family zinc ribbon protein [Streptomyces parvulus]|uniref:FmdB family zinc ribbon protein n=1 Tax=Streptomyces parvulus TaxID=146923 RepID=UPI0033F1DF9A